MSEQNRDNIDDILDIIKKKKQDSMQSGNIQADAPTRLDTKVSGQNSVVENNAEKKEQFINQPIISSVDTNVIASSHTPSTVASSAVTHNQGTNPGANQSIQRNARAQAQNTPPSQRQPEADKTTLSVPRQPQNRVQPTPDRRRTAPSQTRQPNSTISLSDFDNISKTNPKTAKSKSKKFTIPSYAKVIIYLALVLTVSGFLSSFIIKTANDLFAFKKEDKEISVTLNEDLTIDELGDLLEEKGVIGSSFWFKTYYSFKHGDNGYYTGKVISGQHILNSNLSYDSIFSETLVSKYSTEIVRVTIPEGYAAYEIVELFVNKRIVSSENKEAFREKLDSLAYEYDFLPEFAEGEGEDRIYMLEGYLFPDTYDFYVGENLDSIVSKFLNNFDRKFEQAYYDRARELGLSVDEVMTLASMIQAEGNNDQDYYKISSVFHNRLKNANFPYLGSDATTLYSFQGSKKQLEGGDNQNTIHPYNTYLNRGLPPGPICNPGTEAIHAALYPDSTDYYYFYTASTNGVTYFSTSEAQHNRYIQQDRNGTIK